MNFRKFRLTDARKASRQSYRSGRGCYLEYVPGRDNIEVQRKIDLYWSGKKPRTRKAFEAWLNGQGTQQDIFLKYGVNTNTLYHHARLLRLMGLVRFRKK